MNAPVPGLGTFIGGRARIHDPDRDNFSPRLGLSYAPHWFGEPGATRIRVGYGHFNDQILGAVISQSRNVFPTFVTVNTAGGFGNLLFPLLPLGLLNPSNPNLGLVVPGTLNPLNPNVPLAEHLRRINLLASAGGVLPGASGVEATLPARKLEGPRRTTTPSPSSRGSGATRSSPSPTSARRRATCRASPRPTSARTPSRCCAPSTSRRKAPAASSRSSSASPSSRARTSGAGPTVSKGRASSAGASRPATGRSRRPRS